MSKLRIRGLVLVALVSLPLIVRLEPVDVVAVLIFERSQEAASHRGFSQAEETYRQVATRRPRDPQAWQRMGDVYAAWGLFDDALHAYGEAMRRGDDTTSLQRGLAQLYTRLDAPAKSASWWTNYLIRRPKDQTAYLALALTAVRLTDWNRARADLESLLLQEPSNRVIHAWLGLLLTVDSTVGWDHLQEATSDPDVARVLEPVLDAARLSAPLDNPAYRAALLGTAYLDLDAQELSQLSGVQVQYPGEQLEKVTATLAIHSLLSAIQHNPGYADAYAYLGQAFDQMGWSDQARDALEYALQLAPESPVVQILLGLYWDRHDSPTLARHYYETAFQQDPQNAALCLEIANSYAAQGQYTAAEAWLLLAAELAPEDSNVWESLAHFYLDSNIDAKSSGLASATRFAELAPDNAVAHDLVGWAYYLSEEYALAKASLDKALDLDPTLASAHYHLGRVYARQGHYDQASTAYSLAADYDTKGQVLAQLVRAQKDLPAAFRQEP